MLAIGGIAMFLESLHAMTRRVRRSAGRPGPRYDDPMSTWVRALALAAILGSSAAQAKMVEASKDRALSA